MTPTLLRDEQLLTAAPEDAAACAACPHPVAGHDAIGLRFCRATVTGRIDRGCACHST